jgi:hypothetical protein
MTTELYNARQDIRNLLGQNYEMPIDFNSLLIFRNFRFNKEIITGILNIVIGDPHYDLYRKNMRDLSLQVGDFFFNITSMYSSIPFPE